MDEDIFEEENEVVLYPDSEDEQDKDIDVYDEENMDPNFEDDIEAVETVEKEFDKTPSVDDLIDFGYRGEDDSDIVSSEITESDFV